MPALPMGGPPRQMAQVAGSSPRLEGDERTRLSRCIQRDPAHHASAVPNRIGDIDASHAGTIDGSPTLSGGVAGLTLPQLLAGKHAIVAQYSGDSSDATSKAALTETIQGASSSTAITSSLNPSNYGQAVVFTATVTSTAGTPDGTVTFKHGTQALGTVTLSVGPAQLSVTTIDARARTIKATYNGSNTYTTSQNSLQQVVVAAPTTVTLTGSPSPASLGQ